MDLSFVSVCELGSMLRKKEVSAVELTEHFLTQLEGVGTELNAVASVVREHALGSARRADAEFAEGRTVARSTGSRTERRIFSIRLAYRPVGGQSPSLVGFLRLMQRSSNT